MFDSVQWYKHDASEKAINLPVSKTKITSTKTNFTSVFNLGLINNTLQKQPGLYQCCTTLKGETVSCTFVRLFGFNTEIMRKKVITATIVTNTTTGTINTATNISTTYVTTSTTATTTSTITTTTTSTSTTTSTTDTTSTTTTSIISSTTLVMQSMEIVATTITMEHSISKQTTNINENTTKTLIELEIKESPEMESTIFPFKPIGLTRPLTATRQITFNNNAVCLLNNFLLFKFLLIIIVSF